MWTLERHSYLLALLALFITSVLCRPLLPIDETRYMTVAWEMFQTKNYFLLSMNFAPYHHKPPMLFWLINLSWQIFGVSRWSALIPVFFSSAAVLALSGVLAQKLYPDHQEKKEYVSWLLFGSLPFLIYASLVMFDLMLAALNLSVFIMALSHCEKPETRKTVFLGVLLGIGVLIKGPVVYLYTLLPLLFYPYWRFENHVITPKKLYTGLGIALAVSVIPIALWLIPALLQADKDFAYWLIWRQTAGRMEGNFSSSHVRPFYFYTMLLPLLFLPWAFFPSFWKNIKTLKQMDRPEKFILCATLPVFLCFSAIAGKQPHYLLPLLPLVTIALTRVLYSSLEIRKVRITALGVLSAIIVFQLIGNTTFFKDYDLSPIVTYYQANRDKDFAFVHKYQGEIGFLARIEKPIDSIEHNQLGAWFKDHPNGLAIVRRSDDEKFPNFDEVFSMPYRSRKLSVFRLKSQGHENEES
ncbi:MAG: glycosyltransferase family 39 protein [Rhodospirillales bacterium]|nr:glycosyltransferase family 39 protein [Alphaproteobacteria bacterium]MCB9976869.1 glycosyltransferase family 39 protein [Rhodospirillales bacterium]